MQDTSLGIWEVGDGCEYQTLRPGQGFYGASFSPDGRLAVAARSDGIAFRDVELGAELAFLPLKRPGRAVAFEPGQSGALLIGDESGLYRWPVRPDPDVAGQRRIGPPQALDFPAGTTLARSADGRVLATAFHSVDWYEPWAGAWVRRAGQSDQFLHMDAGADIRGFDLSPDGRWLATYDAKSGRVKLWDARTGGLVRILRENGGPVHFSPDGRWLAVDGTPGCLLGVGGWEEKRKLGDSAQFSADSRMIIFRTDSALTFRLSETVTGKELAEFEDPNADRPWCPTFSPDGSRLMMFGNGIHVWNLRRIRTELARRDLDWDASPYPPEPSPSAPLTVKVELGDFDQLRPQRLVQNYDRAVQAAEQLAIRWFLREKLHKSAGRYAEALRDLREAVTRRQDNARMCAELARLCVFAPEPFRDAEAGHAMAERAIKLQPGNWRYVNTLGIAYYRLGRYRDAVAQLQKSLAGGAGEADAADLYFLAMCYQQLGDCDQARDCWLRAQAWHDAKTQRLAPEEAEELRVFRAETKETLATMPRH
jgi:WD40 repeat protein/Flp pilus assembly protein TadD